MISLDLLRKVAEASQAFSPGPWACEEVWGSVRVNDRSGFRVCEAPAEMDACHIATFDPTTVLGLLDLVAELTRERDQSRAELAQVAAAVAENRCRQCGGEWARSYGVAGQVCGDCGGVRYG